MKVANQFFSRLEDDSIELIRKPFNQTRKIFLFWCSTTRISHLQKKKQLEQEFFCLNCLRQSYSRIGMVTARRMAFQFSRLKENDSCCILNASFDPDARLTKFTYLDCTTSHENASSGTLIFETSLL